MLEVLHQQQTVFLKKELYEKGELVVTVRGHCMKPFLKDGDQILVKHVDPESVVKGDVVFYESQDKFFAHRVIRKKDGIVTTKADRFVQADAPITEDQVLGKIIARKEGGAEWAALDASSSRWNRLATQALAPFVATGLWIKKTIFSASRQRNAQHAILVFLKQQPLSDDLIVKMQWHIFLEEVYRQGVSGLLFQRLKQTVIKDQCPLWVWQKLEQDYLSNLGRNMLLEQSIQSFVEDLSAKEIVGFVVRGASLLEQGYVDIGARPFMDLDLVVDHEDFGRMQSFFQDQGFEWFDEYPYLYKKQEFYVDLHLNSLQFWRLQWPTPIHLNNRALWERTKPFYGSEYVRQLDVYDHILHCCEHLMRHNYEKLMWFMDIVLMIEKDEDFSWDQLYERAYQVKFIKPIRYVFEFLHHHLMTVDENFLERIRSVPLNWVEQRSLQKLIRNQRAYFCGEWLAFFMVSGWRQRWQLFSKGALIEEDKLPIVRRKNVGWIYVKRVCKMLMHQLWKGIYFLKP